MTQVIKETSRFTLHGEVIANVEQGAEVFTDTHSGYSQLGREYRHKTVDHSIEFVNGDAHTNGLENFWTLVKRCIRGTYVGVAPVHVNRYLEEESFRYNNRKDNDGERFVRTLGAVAGKRITYKRLTGKVKPASA